MRREILHVTAAQREELRKRLVRRAWELMDEIDAALHSGGPELGVRGGAEIREIRAALERLDTAGANALETQPGGPQ